MFVQQSRASPSADAGNERAAHTAVDLEANSFDQMSGGSVLERVWKADVTDVFYDRGQQHLVIEIRADRPRGRQRVIKALWWIPIHEGPVVNRVRGAEGATKGGDGADILSRLLRFNDEKPIKPHYVWWDGLFRKMNYVITDVAGRRENVPQEKVMHRPRRHQELRFFLGSWEVVLVVVNASSVMTSFKKWSCIIGDVCASRFVNWMRSNA